MWMFMLVMMVFTRTRSEEVSRVPTNQSMAKGSTSAIVLRPKRRRNHNTTNTSGTEQLAETESEQRLAESEQHAETEQQPAEAEQSVVPPNRRGPNLNLSITKTLQKMPEGSKITLTMDKDTKAFVGTSSTPFATECGIVVRNFCPMNYHTWDSVPKEAKNLMYEKLEGKFELLRTNEVFMEYVNARLQTHWKRIRGIWSRHWKNNGGKTNPKLARSKVKPGCLKETWGHMCDYWELEKTQKYSYQMEANRAKQVNISRGGSRSIANHTFQLTNPETHMPPSPLELYHKMHYNATKQGWLNDDSRLEYENIIQHKQTAMEKLISEGTTVTNSMEHEIEKEAIKSVRGRKKTIQSAWEVGVGPVLRKKDSWMKSVVESSQRDSSENEVLRNKVIALEAKQKRDKEVYEKMFEFISTKFPDFESTIATQASDEDEGDNTI